MTAMREVCKSRSIGLSSLDTWRRAALALGIVPQRPRRPKVVPASRLNPTWLDGKRPGRPADPGLLALKTDAVAAVNCLIDEGVPHRDAYAIIGDQIGKSLYTIRAWRSEWRHAKPSADTA